MSHIHALITLFLYPLVNELLKSVEQLLEVLLTRDVLRLATSENVAHHARFLSNPLTERCRVLSSDVCAKALNQLHEAIDLRFCSSVDARVVIPWI